MTQLDLSETPRVSIIMANYCGSRYLRAAITSALSQSLKNIEVIISDDASTDDSVDIVKAMMAQDDRVKLIASPINGGPAKARNLALGAARGEWIAIVDSDDLQHPMRLERLLQMAVTYEADMVADDLLHFHNDGTHPISFLLTGKGFNAPFLLTPELFIRANTARSGLPTLGYLKPVIRAECLRGVRYDESLKVAEDYDLVLRLLVQGLKCHVVPDPTYLYRRHGASISHRLSQTVLSDMIDNHIRFERTDKSFQPEVRQALSERLKGMKLDLSYEHLVAAFKARRFAAALGIMIKAPALCGFLLQSATERFSRKAVTTHPHGDKPQIHVPTAVILSDAAPQTEDLNKLKTFASQYGAAKVIFETIPDGFSQGAAFMTTDEGRTFWGRIAKLCNLGSLPDTLPNTLIVVCDGAKAVNFAGYIPRSGAPVVYADTFGRHL